MVNVKELEGIIKKIHESFDPGREVDCICKFDDDKYLVTRDEMRKIITRFKYDILNEKVIKSEGDLIEYMLQNVYFDNFSGIKTIVFSYCKEDEDIDFHILMSNLEVSEMQFAECKYCYAINKLFEIAGIDNKVALKK